jgi:hypothetical protein
MAYTSSPYHGAPDYSQIQSSSPSSSAGLDGIATADVDVTTLVNPVGRLIEDGATNVGTVLAR